MLSRIMQKAFLFSIHNPMESYHWLEGDVKWKFSTQMDDIAICDCVVYWVKDLDELNLIKAKEVQLSCEGKPCFLVLDEKKLTNLNIENVVFDAIFTPEVFKEWLKCSRTPINTWTHNGIYFKVKNRLEKILFDDILWVQARDIYSVIKTHQARFLVSHTLREIDEKLAIYGNFQRIQRSHLVNLTKIEAIDHKELVIAGEYLPIGQAYREQLFQKILLM